MKSRTTLRRRLLLVGALALSSVAMNIRAQQPAPSPSPQTQTTTSQPPTASNDETMMGGYTVTSSIEVGVRGLSVVGNGNKYRSDLNYRPGLRLFDSSFLLKRKEGRGTLFDELLVNTSGWGADPQGYTRVNVEKTGVYRFDANVRRFKYFNNLVNLALNQHTQNTRLQFGDYDLTLLPDNPRFKFYLGYSRDTQRGPGLITYDFSRDEFAISSNQQSSAHNWREGVDAKLGPIDISFLMGARYFKDDSSFTTSFNRGNNPTNTSRIDTLRREMPTTGHHFFTRFSAHTFIAKKLDITGRFIYTQSRTNFDFLEQVTGRSGVAPGNIIRLEEFRTSGQVKRPYGVGDFGVTFLATDKLRFSDTFRFDNFRINGGDVLADFLLQSTPAGAPLPATTTNNLFLRSTAYRRLMNTVEADYQFSTHFAAHIGYRFTDRRVRLFQFNQNTTPRSTDETFVNRTNSVIFGFKARPIPGWNIYFDGEHGSADSVFTRIENNKFTNLRVRSRYAPNDKLSFSFSVVTRNNSNPSEVLQSSTLLPAGTAPDALDVAVKSRTFSTSVDWTPTQKLSLSTGFTHLRVTSNAGIILFITNQSRLGQSQYFMRDNFFFFNAFVNPSPRVTLFASYRISKDPGQGSRASSDPAIIIGSYPMAFQSPEARLVIKLNRRIDWNIGYQYYNYRDRFFPVQNYHAHLPFTSLRIYFGGRESQ
jgi:hypothetical protein